MVFGTETFRLEDLCLCCWEKERGRRVEVKGREGIRFILPPLLPLLPTARFDYKIDENYESKKVYLKRDFEWRIRISVRVSSGTVVRPAMKLHNVI